MTSKMSPSEETDTNKEEGSLTKRSSSPERSCVSMKSHQSMDNPFKLRTRGSPADLSSLTKRSSSPEPSCVSMKSHQSMDNPLKFRNRGSPADLRFQQKKSVMGHTNHLEFIFKELEHKVISLLKKELERFKNMLSADYTSCSGKEVQDEEDSSIREEVIKITLKFLRNMKHTDLANTLQNKLASGNQKTLKFKLMEKCKRVNDGISQHGASALLNEIYTDLYITEGWRGEVNNEHEVRQIENVSRRPTTQETPIRCNDLFKDKTIRTVLTKGVAGIGKTVSVQKFILDWAEGKANQDVIFIFPLPFRELNLMKEKNLSLMELLHAIFPEIKNMSFVHSDAYKVIFIFDGLDECRLPLDFHNNEGLWDVSESASVDVLLTNLLKGNLFPSALLWITTRPAAANLIPAECVDQVTEVRGFSDPQKEEYFRKRIRDQSLANRIITHLKSSRSLYIMCHIPVFCWIAATVLERLLGEAERKEIPKTLTQMFTHFLIYQIKHKGQKYHGKCDTDPHQTRETVLALGKLAFQQLEKGNLIFYEEDLRECGIDVTEVSVYSGVCTQIFREEFGLHLGKAFCFVHLSVQEFLAALYAFISFISNKGNLEVQTTDLSSLLQNSSMSDFLKTAVDKALQRENGQLDLFLRFLLGLSLESNQTLLQDLLTQTGSSSYFKAEIVRYIKRMIRENPSQEKSINLLYCLNELNDDSLVQEVQTYLSRDSNWRLCGLRLSPDQWSALMFVLLNSEEDLDVFDLRTFDKSEECFMRLLPVVKTSRKVVLCGCDITDKGCAALASALISNPSSQLRELDLNRNKLNDSGVKQLCALLENPQCTLEILQLCNCSITGEGFAALALALISNPSSHLRELHLNHNNPGDVGVKQLSALLENPHCKLEILKLTWCSITDEGFAALTSALISNPSSHLRELDLKCNKAGDSGVKELSALLKNPQCTLETLLLCSCNITSEGCTALASALTSNPSSHLKELNLKHNKTRDLGATQLSALLKKPHCKLEMLQLCNCNITDEGCAALASALISNPSSRMRELHLNRNKAGDLGTKQLSILLKNPHCTLEILQLCNCSITGKGFAALASALISNPSLHLRELHLNSNKAEDAGVKQLSALLKNPHCTLEILQLSDCCITDTGFSALASALISNPSSTLRELHLNRNKAGNSGVKQLSALLENPHCTLETLQLSDCSITDVGFAALASALISNPSSHLRELHLNSNNPRDSGMKQLSALLKNPQCTLEILELSGCSITGEGCAALASALISNPSSHMRELNLNHNNPGDSGVKELCGLLENPHCTLQKLQFKTSATSKDL